MAKFTIPKTTFGQTIGSTAGTNSRMDASSTSVSGSIDYESLNRRRFTDNLEYNEFYKSISDFVYARLGYPVVRVELTEFQIMTGIDEAISKLDYHAPDWCTQLMTFITEEDINLYKLPSFVINNLRYAAFKKTLLSIAQQNGTLEFDFFLKYFQDNFLFSDFNVSDFLVLQMHLEQIRKVLGREGSFQVIDNQYLFITPTPRAGELEEVVVEYKVLNSETIHHYYLNWLQRYSLAVAKSTLSQVRSKYKVIPSPDGGAQLNGQELGQQATMEKSELIDELMNEIEEPMPFTLF